MTRKSSSIDSIEAEQRYRNVYKYVIDQFEFGKVRNPEDAVDLIRELMKFVRVLAYTLDHTDKFSELAEVYFKLGHLADNVIWNYDVKGYFDKDKIIEDLEVINSTVEKIVD